MTPDANYLTSVVYVMFRIMPLFVVSPVDVFRRVPMTVRLVFALSLALVIASFDPTSSPASATLGLAIDPTILLSELMLGIVLCFSFHAASASIHFVGQLIDMQIGFVAATAFDPNFQRMAGPTSVLLGLLLSVSFFLTGFHYAFLEGVKDLYEYVPTGSIVGFQASWVSVFGRIFAFGFVLASPVVIMLLMADITFAIISRSMPQVQIYFVGLPLKIILGLLTMAWVIDAAGQPLLQLLLGSLHEWDHIIRI